MESEINNGAENVNNNGTVNSVPDRKKKLFLILGIVLGSCFIIALLFHCLFKMQRWERITYELGTSIESDINYYMMGSSFALRKGTLDISGVDNMTTGSYIATVSFGKKEYDYLITIVDTVDPEIVLNSDLSNINIGIEHDYSAVLKEATDLSGPVDVWITVDGKKCDTLFFESCGSYDVKVYAEDINDNLAEKSFTLVAVDTIPPFITGREELPCFGVWDSYSLEDFIEGISDNSGAYNVYVTVNDSKVDDIVFDDSGEYSINVIASDEMGNVSNFLTTAYADYRPVFYGTNDRVIKKGSEYDFLEGIFAWDNEEGFINDRISYEATVDLDTPGEYTISYSTVDKHGLAQTCDVTYRVDGKSYNANVEYDEDFVDKLFDADWFQYELLTEKDEEKANELMYPCQIALQVPGSFSGSGFIYKIEKDYIYIGTMGHCISKKMKTSGMNLWVYNPTYNSRMSHKSTKRCLENIVAEDIYYVHNSSEDYGMIKISTSKFPADVLAYLKEVNKTNEQNISFENGIYTDTIYVAKDMYTGRFKKSFNVFDKQNQDNWYSELFEYFPQYKDRTKWLQTNETGVSGQSGSLLYDGYGNPVASLSGSTVWGSAKIGRHRLFNVFASAYAELTKQEE